MDWGNDVVFEFLDLYESEPIIWDPQNQVHKDRNQVYDAWIRIQKNMSVECSLNELKKKKEALMATYRKLVMKAKKIESETNESYKPEWFAYDKMASFLHTIYKPRGPKVIERKEDELNDNEDDPPDIDDERTNPPTADTIESSGANTDSQDEESRDTADPVINQCKRRTAKKRKAEVENTGHVEELMYQAFFLLKHIAKKPEVPRMPKDECDMFCDLLNFKLKALDVETRDRAMHEINNLMYHFKTLKM